MYTDKEKLIQSNITDVMERAYIDYSMSVIISRALPASDSLAFSPPFVITEAQIDRVVEGVREAVDEVAAELKASGDWAG